MPSYFGLLKKKSIQRSLVSGTISVVRSPGWQFQLIRLILVCAVPTFLFFYHDPNRHFLWTTDWDISVVYEALLINSGLDNFSPASAGYGLFFLLAKWYQFLNFMGVLDIITLEGIPPFPASDAVFQELTYWGRILTLFTTLGLSVILLFFTQTLTGSRFYGFLAALAFSGTRSFNTHVLFLHSELLSANFAYLAILFALFIIIKQQNLSVSLGFMALSAFFAMLALSTKLSALPIILLIPLFVIVFSTHMSRGNRNAPIPSFSQLGGGGIALIALAMAGGLYTFFPFLTLMGKNAYFYNGIIALYVIGCIIFYCRMRRLFFFDMAAGSAAIMLGLGGAVWFLFGDDPFSKLDSVSNHVDTMAHYTLPRAAGVISADNGMPENPIPTSTMVLIGNILSTFAANLKSVFTDSFFNFCWVCRRSRIIYFLSLFALIAVWRKSDGNTRLCATFLILSVIAIEIVERFHPYNAFYQMYVETLLFASLAFYLSRISLKSSLTARKSLAVFSLIFVMWFWIEDANRKMLWPTFAAHIGTAGPYVHLTPLIADRFTSYTADYEEYVRKMKAKELPPGSVPYWWEDNRSFLGTGKPWRTWNNK